MTATILFVDDESDIEELIKQKFKRKIRQEKYSFLFASNGLEALDKINAHSNLDLVISDINMSGMDGLTLLAKIKELEPAFKTIIISAAGDMGNIRKAMNLGAFDFLLKPLNLQDLEITIQKTLEYVKQIKQNQQQLYQAHEQIDQQEKKMAVLGHLVADIAHDINNPLTFVTANLDHTKIYIKDLLDHLQLHQQHSCKVPEIDKHAQVIDLEFLTQDLPKIIDSLQVGTERIREISNSLRTFSRADTDAKQAFNLHEGLDSTLTILQHRLKENKKHGEIKIIKEYGELPLVDCYPGQLNQVFMNILANAIDALDMHDKQWQKLKREIEDKEEIYQTTSLPTPTIIIATKMTTDSWVAIHISDNGLGIEEQICSKLFEPFFTTKPVGKGTGLGLSICYQIVVEKHGGKMHCRSKPGEGAEFVIELPSK